MVKSKNKKSVIALVVMAFLLVASIVLAATGAWFSATADKSLTSGDLTFGALTIGSTTGSSLQLSHNGGAYAEVTEDKLVMPGDKIKGATVSFTVTSTDDCGFYYAIKSGNVWYKIVAGQLAEIVDDQAVLVAKTSETLTFGSDAEVTIPTNTGNDQQGQNYAVSNVYSGTYSLYVIQAANITDAAQALTEIKAL